MDTIKGVTKLYKNRKLSLFFFFVLLIIISRLNVYSQTIIGNIIDNITNESFKHFVYIFVIVSMIFYLVKLVFTLLEKKLSNRLTNDLKKRLCNKIINMKYETLNKYSINDIFQIWNKDINELLGIIDSVFLNFGMIFMSAIFAVIQLSVISVWITIVALAINAIAMLPIFFLSNKNKKVSQNLRESEVIMNDKFLELFQSIRLIKAFGKEYREIDGFEGKNQLYVNNKITSLVITRIHKSLISIIDSLVQVIVLILGSFAVVKGQMTIGNIVVAISLLSIVNKPFSESGKILVDFKAIGYKIKKLEDFLSKEEEVRGGKALDLNEKFTLKVNNVGYSVGQKKIINNICFCVKGGERVAVVGESGSGKTTLNNILLRLYQPCEGEILIDDVNIDNYSIDSYRAYIHYSQSNTYLLNDTILNNMLLFGAEENEIIKIAKAIGFHNEISCLQNGYDTIINPNASNLSGGQKKKLEIIRAIARKKEIYIFDEITKGIDNNSAAAIMSYIINTINKTIFITMHDLYQIETFDQIIVMKEGNIIAIGKHYDLLQQCLYYKELYENNNRRDDYGISEAVL